jgi:hypothetical protein
VGECHDPCTFVDQQLNDSETMATESRQPLLFLNAKDIGTFAERTEDRLSYWFFMATKLGIMLLIEDCDNFLTERSPHNVDKNAVASGGSIPDYISSSCLSS